MRQCIQPSCFETFYVESRLIYGNLFMYRRILHFFVRRQHKCRNMKGKTEMRKVICLSLCTLFLCASSVYGNSAPSYWKAYPYSDVLAIAENSPIAVDRERLTFDFSEADEYYESRNVMSPVGKVTAEYRMTNTSDDTLTVQMAFPFAASLNKLFVGDIDIRADGSAVPYEIYIDPGNINDYDYGSIGNISDHVRTLPGFSLDSVAKLYRFSAASKENPYLDFKVSFNADQPQAFLIGKDFNAASYSEEGRGTLSSRILEKIEPEILVLGKDQAFTYEVLTDEGKKADQGSYQLEITQDSVDPKEYLQAALREEIGEETAAAISGTQLFNLFLQELWQNRLSSGYTTLYDGFSALSEDHIFTLVYQVEFPPVSTRIISVGYLTEGTMDRRETDSPKYTYTYLLSPAKNWSDFGGLDIEVITPRAAPYMIANSLGLSSDSENRYSAHFDGLPESELTFTLYENETVTMIDKAERAIQKSSYLLFFLWPVIVLILTAIAITAARSIIRRRQSH